jgi:hypothetical protein
MTLFPDMHAHGEICRVVIKPSQALGFQNGLNY